MRLASLLPTLLLVLAALSVHHPVAAQTCDRSGCGFSSCATPSFAVPQALWGELQPTDTGRLPVGRDSSGFTEGTGARYDSTPWFMWMDTANGWMFTSNAWGLTTWDIHTDPTQPAFAGSFGFRNFPVWSANPETKWPLVNVSVPQNDDTFAVVGGISSIGMAILDTTSKAQPMLLYQAYDSETWQTYAAKIGGKNYAFEAAYNGNRVSGLLAFNMDVARTFHGCAEDVSQTINCPGVYIGRIGTRIPNFVSGVDQFVVASSGAGRGFDLYDVTNPAQPVVKLSGLGDRSVYGTALWHDSGHYYLAARTDTFDPLQQRTVFPTYIFDVTCIATSCASMPSPIFAVNVDDVATQNFFATFSREGATPMLYLGSDNRCGAVTTQREWIYDVTNPASPREITPSPQLISVNGTPTLTGYWGWYYRSNPTGFNYMAPFTGKFVGDYFYRAGWSILDVHKHATNSPPVAAFTYSPLQVYPGVPVNFTDRSLGAPNSWTWGFSPDGNPSVSTLQNPQGVTFASKGQKTVSLTVTNRSGSNTAPPQTIQVLDPAPALGSLTITPQNPLQCQPITFAPTSATGAPPLNFNWQIIYHPATGGPVAAPGGQSTASTFLWDTKANNAAAGSYTVSLAISNTSGTTPLQSLPFTLGQLPALPGASAFSPSNDAFSAGTVQFHVNAPGATEWNWNFGDNPTGGPNGDGYSGWTNDPAAGPNPQHIYTATGLMSVTVKVRNCTSNQNGIVSAILPVDIQNVVPLVAHFQAICAFAPCSFTAGTAITFIDSSTGAAFWDYDWDGTGTFADAGHTSPVTTHTYSTAGNFAPVLRVRRGASESNTYVHPFINISPAVPASISITGPTSGAPATSYTYSAFASGCSPSPTGWSWSVGDGTISGGSTGSSIAVSWATTGAKSISAVNSGCFGATGVTSVSISTGSTGGGALTANFTFSPSSPGVGVSVSFDASSSQGSPSTYRWDFGDKTGGTGQIITHTYSTAGTYAVMLEVTAPGSGANCFFGTCASDKTINITVGGGSNAQFTISPSSPHATDTVTFDGTSSTGSPSSYTWNFGDNAGGTGAVVTHSYAAAGNYVVTLTVNAPGTGASMSSQTLVVSPPSGPPPPSAAFTASVSCVNAGINECSASTGQTVTLTATSTSATSFSWIFGDGATGTGASVTHAWAAPGQYAVTLNVTGVGGQTATSTATFVLTGPPTKSVVLPWIAQTRGALVQSTDLYVHNPTTQPMDVILTFLKRGTPDVNPPRVTKTLQPSQTLYAPDVLTNLFNRENVAGFVTVTAQDVTAPVINSFNTTFQADGTQFGQSVAGVSLLPASSSGNSSSRSSSGTVQNLIGLSDDDNRFSYFGVSNPNSTPATFHLSFFDSTGKQIASSSPDFTLGGFGQRQFQVNDIRSMFNVQNITDYRVQVQSTSGGELFPYGSNLQNGSQDPSFISVGSTTSPKLYLIGAFSTAGSWQSDVVLANTGTQQVATNMTFTRVGNAASPTKPVALTLQPGATQRLTDAINTQFGLNDTVGVITLNSTTTASTYPIVQGESYNNAQPAQRYGQSMSAQSDADAATTGQAAYLVGLRQDATHSTTIWLFNPGTDSGLYDVVYFGLDGSVLGRLDNAIVGPGKLRQFLPSQLQIPAAGVEGGFTVQVVVKNGSLLSAAQVLNVTSGDPAYIKGEAR